MTPGWDPKASYRRLRDERAGTARRCERRAALVSNARLLVFLLLLVASFLAFGRGTLASGWVAALAIVFMALVMLHDRILRAASDARSSEAFFDTGLTRLGGRFLEIPCADPGRDTAEHPYADDLDCLGRGSLFHRIDTARTRVGKGALADWLLAGASPEVVRSRQQSVADLRPRLDLRERLGTLGGDAKEAVESELLVRWGETAPHVFARGQRLAARILPAVTVAAIAGWWVGMMPPLAIASALGVQMGFAAWLRPRVRALVRDVEAPARELVLLSGLLRQVESESFEAAPLRALQSALSGEETGASERIDRLRRLTDLLDARRNQLFAPIAGLLLWATNVSFSIEDWRARNGGEIRRWIEAFGEIEALVSLAAYAYERPGDSFPELLEGGPVVFEATGLGHPLLDDERCVRNDLALNRDLRMLLISGSNMSGKSTLLRAVGANAVLALAGAPVHAQRLVISPLQLGASVQLRDSLLGGQSRFYAEIQRLRRVFELADRDSPPVLFLLDEILHGTNAQERRVGAEAVVAGLLERGAAGLVTTHDLALTEMVERHASSAANRHFADHVEEGKLRFDYRLRDGVATQGNALALMRAVGLPV
jgi:hypothetical protein